MNNNYQLIDQKFVKYADAEVYLLRHKKSGARVIKIANSDKNKTFGITFKTQPDSDCGTPHIMEHSVLNGSKKYPVKSPFDQLLKGSLSTFLNAMTGGELTMYPVASICEKDYFNLMDVYLDAVFNPLIYNDPRIMKQEGWRIMLTSPDEMPAFTGVVYNEMKGYFSDPLRELDFRISQKLFPDNGYGKCSGGYPSEITKLTQEKFIEFHKKFYHPENSYIFFYGDADFEKELDLLDRNYLCHYDIKGFNYEIPLQKPFAAPKTINCYYPAAEGTDPETDSYLALSFVAGKNTDTELCLALDILADVLVFQESGAIRKAFQNAEIGSDIDVSFENSQQPVFTFIGHQCNAQDGEKFKNLILDTLKTVVKDGIDKNTITAVVNRREFGIREGNDAQKGIKLLFELIMPWLFDDNAIQYLEIPDALAQLKKDIADGYLEKVIEKYFINNPHSLLTTLAPKAGLEEENEAKTAQYLIDYKNSLTKEQIDQLIKDTKDLDDFQNAEETPEQLKCIPVLSKEDLNPKAEDLPLDIVKNGDTEILCRRDTTNGIIYCNLMFDARTLDFEDLPYLSLLGELLVKLDTEKYDYETLDNMFKTYTGGVSTFPNIYAKQIDKVKTCFPKFNFSTKALTENAEKALSLLEEVVLHTKFDDRRRIKEMIIRTASQLESEASSMPFYYVRNRADSYYDKASFINEYFEGLDYYYFIKDINENFDARADEIVDRLKKVYKQIVNKAYMKFVVASEQDDRQKVLDIYDSILKRLPADNAPLKKWDINPTPKNEGFTGSSKVQYVIKSYNFKDTDFKWTGAINVLNKILSLNYLHNAIRVRGGAYGCFAQIGIDGAINFASYRDPNLTETLSVYNNVAEFVNQLDITPDEMLKYIIGTISGIDQPMTVTQRTNAAVTRYINGKKIEKIQKIRDEIINTTVNDVKTAVDILKAFADKGSVCVYGGEETIKANANLFDKILKLTK